ncbi:hypothetical protein DL89DRAFT_31379 [Linderina pennispora]|uniref:Uncharacterized protein n=1 Tax=Linderina pennispora TaxID=61395 RepID=A0A1Y1W441_9FUNG|nr:uncharacterized protein DL89DRAFT_31379 [Linderina pennispora]ORX68319.1 hypothetical protein DL89DRAFT_31379 [Linderina pennispora]
MRPSPWPLPSRWHTTRRRWRECIRIMKLRQTHVTLPDPNGSLAGSGQRKDGAVSSTGHGRVSVRQVLGARWCRSAMCMCFRAFRVSLKSYLMPTCRPWWRACRIRLCGHLCGHWWEPSCGSRRLRQYSRRCRRNTRQWVSSSGRTRIGPPYRLKVLLASRWSCCRLLVVIEESSSSAGES